MGDEPPRGPGGRGFDLSQTRGPQLRVKGPRPPPGPFPLQGARVPRSHLQLPRPGPETRPGLGGLGAQQPEPLHSVAWSRRRTAWWRRAGGSLTSTRTALRRGLPTPHPTPSHPCSLSGDGEGLILILQNAQQLIKSRSPGFGVLLHVNGGGKSPARLRRGGAVPHSGLMKWEGSLSEPRANKAPRATNPAEALRGRT